MWSDEVAMLIPEDGAGAALIMRRADGQFAFGRIDARLARAARAAAVRCALRALEREDERGAPAPRLIEIRRN